MRQVLFMAPLALFVAGAIWVAVPLIRGDDPSGLPSSLIVQPVPQFTLPPLPGREDGLATADLGGEVTLVNVFASWCVPCLAEHPIISRLAEDGVPVMGLNYRDDPADALAWLDTHGDPYRQIGADTEGRIAIDTGAYATGILTAAHLSLEAVDYVTTAETGRDQ